MLVLIGCVVIDTFRTIITDAIGAEGGGDGRHVNGSSGTLSRGTPTFPLNNLVFRSLRDFGGTLLQGSDDRSFSLGRHPGKHTYELHRPPQWTVVVNTQHKQSIVYDDKQYKRINDVGNS